ncbi:MAG: peptide MFS transporter [Rhabdochlamydiaceae bacterium]|nr:peptide MFS transporter [Rhabdochlamydiaceae bacterium]
MKSFFSTKHPKEMYLLAVSEMCQRFAFWGIANLLVLYLVEHHHFADAKADTLFGLFTGIAFVLPVLGGWIADRTSYRLAVIWGSILNAIGCFLMATGSVSFLYVALFFAAAGGCIFTPGIYTILGHVYHDKQNLREGGFSIYYCSVNVGIFLAMIVLGWIGQTKHWSIAFVLAGIIQILGLLPFFKVMKKIGSIHQENHILQKSKISHPVKKHEKDRIIVICILAFFSIIFWLAFNQGGSSMTLFALRYTDRSLFGFQMPPSWLLSLESLYLVLFAFPLTALYIYLAKRKQDPSPPMKCALGLLAMGLCFLIMVFGASKIAPGAQEGSLSPFYLMGAYLLMALGEMLISPIGLSLVTHLSPRKYTAMLVGVWYLCIGIGFYAGGLFATLMAELSSLAAFFNIYVLLSFIGAACLILLAKKLDKMRHADKF